MSFMKKLCDVYDAVIGTDGAKGGGALLPVGFVQKTVKYNIILSPSGKFVIAQLIPDGEQTCAVPSSLQAMTASILTAMSRSWKRGAPQSTRRTACAFCSTI